MDDGEVRRDIIRDRLAGLRAVTNGRRITRLWCRSHARQFWAHFLTVEDIDLGCANPEGAPSCPVCLAQLTDDAFARWLEEFKPLTTPRT